MVTFDQLSRALVENKLEPVGKLVDSSNQALVCELDGFRVVYKPAALENPLWDFPGETLSLREVCASEIDRLLGWNLVPPTVWIENGPVGEGSVQVYIEGAELRDVSIFESGEVPQGWSHIVTGQLEDREVDVAHTSTSEVYRLSVFDALINNADRKGGHLLRDSQGHLWAIDHGVTLHEEPKLRTVLWGWAGEPLQDAEAIALRSFVENIEQLELVGLLPQERQALEDRAFRLLAKGLPLPSRRWPSIPWPVF